MFRRSIFFSIIASFIIAAGAVVVSAQTTAPVSGKVELVKADGSREPIAGALVEVYRTDIRSGHPSTKTNKKGEFYFAGFMLGAEYALSFSAPNATPEIRTGIKAGQENVAVTMSPGDGRKWTESEVRGAVAGGSTGSGGGGDGGLTDEEKQQMAEIEKKNAEIIAKNKKLAEGDAIVRKSITEGQAALNANNYDLAISKFDEGITAVPDFVGMTPVMLNGKMMALNGKAVTVYNESLRASDPASKKAKQDEANKLFDDVLAAFKTAVEMINTAPAATDPQEQKNRQLVNLRLHEVAMETHQRKVVTRLDLSKTEDASKVIEEYIELEPDQKKKVQARKNLGDIMREAGDFEKAVVAYREVLELNPDNPEAMAGLGLSLFAEGAAQAPEDKEKMQEGLNYMQKYIEIAPIADTDSKAVKELKTSVKETVEYLKSQKMTPQKVSAPKKRG